MEILYLTYGRIGWRHVCSYCRLTGLSAWWMKVVQIMVLTCSRTFRDSNLQCELFLRVCVFQTQYKRMFAP